MKKQIFIALLIIFIGYPTVNINSKGNLAEISIIKKIELKTQTKKSAAARSLSSTSARSIQPRASKSRSAAIEPKVDALLQGNILSIFLNEGFINEYVTITIRDMFENIVHEERVMVNSAMEVSIMLDNDENGKYLLEIDSNSYYFYGMF